MTLNEAEQLYVKAQRAQFVTPEIDRLGKQLVMLTAQAAGLRGRSTTTPTTVRTKALEVLCEVEKAKFRLHALIEACMDLERPAEERNQR
jgi:hypothetical protein